MSIDGALCTLKMVLSVLPNPTPRLCVALMLKIIVSKNSRGLDSIQLSKSLPRLRVPIADFNVNSCVSLKTGKDAMVSQLTHLEYLATKIKVNVKIDFYFQSNLMCR